MLSKLLKNVLIAMVGESPKIATNCYRDVYNCQKMSQIA